MDFGDKVYKNPIRSSRYLSYPDGGPHLTSVLRRFADGRESRVSARILEEVDLSRGHFYITVPFDCPENPEIENLNDGKFFLETQKSQELGERYREDVVTTDQTNEAIFELVRNHGYSLVFDRSAEPRPRPPVQEEALYEGRTRRRYSGNDGEQILTAACLGSIDELRYLVAPGLKYDAPHDELLQPSGANLTLIACYIFDWTGYLLWFPKSIS